MEPLKEAAHPDPHPDSSSGDGFVPVFFFFFLSFFEDVLRFQNSLSPQYTHHVVVINVRRIVFYFERVQREQLILFWKLSN